MKKVQFTLAKEGNMIVYPDDIALFANTQIIDDMVVGDYYGALALDAYVEPADPVVYLHIGIAGGDGADPTGIVNDGVDALTVSATLRESEDAASAVVALTGAWRITIRGDAGQVYDIVRVTVTDGVAQVSYTTNAAPDICQITEDDLIPVTVDEVEYRVCLIGDLKFKVYRQL